MTLDVVVATMHCPGWSERVLGWTLLMDKPVQPIVIHNTPERNLGVVGSYQAGLEQSEAAVIAYIHDDVIIREGGWDVRALREFDDPEVGLVGFGGALVHGTSDLYKRPYDYRQLGRAGYRSNVDDAEVHGERFTGSCEVAVLDGFVLIVRRALLDRAGGWPGGTPVDYSLYDYWVCATVRRLGFRVRLVGVRCHHLGGGTAVGMKMAEGSGQAHMDAHRFVYDEFRDVLPWRCQ